MSLFQALPGKRMHPLALIVSFLLLLMTHFAGAQTALLIKAGKMYDAENKRFLTHQEILVKGNTIVQVGKKIRVPKGTKILDLPHATVTPGLMDMHTHLLVHQRQKEGLEICSKVPTEKRLQQAFEFARDYLLVGITTVRDLGNSGQYLDVRLQDSLKKVQVPAPRLFVSGPIISPPGGQFNHLSPSDTFLIRQEYYAIRGVVEASAAVQKLVNRGVNVIKVCMNTDNGTLSSEEIQAIVKTAHQKGIPVTAHTTYDASARKAVLAGVDGIEHGYVISDTTLQLMAQRGTYLVPTDVSRQMALILVAGQGMKEAEGKAYADEFLNSTHDRLVRAVKKGVMIVSGADYFNDLANISRGNGSKDVLVAYQEAGIPVTDVLGFATRNAAKALGLSNSLGTLKKGMKADIAVFEGDLEKEFAKTLFAVQWVIKDGILYNPKEQP
ncbi:MAG: amidohydrolase family protein [Bacteroidota bacterium]